MIATGNYTGERMENVGETILDKVVMEAYSVLSQ